MSVASTRISLLGGGKMKPKAGLEGAVIPTAIIVVVLAACSPAPSGCEPPPQLPTLGGGLLTAPPPNPSAGDAFISAADGMTLVYVPGGTFLMGAKDGDPFSHPSERPAHEVQISPFWIDRTEITNATYAECVAAGACDPPAEDGSYGRARYFTEASCADYPVVHVQWYDAENYCRWAGRRLLTEAEWELAARGTDGRLYPWGSEAPSGDQANFCDGNCPAEDRDESVNDGYAGEAPSEAFPDGASPYGVLNMAGNVWEWVTDWSGVSYYAQSPRVNPTGPESGEAKVLRGGSWLNNAIVVLSSSRNAALPEVEGEAIGFRCGVSDISD